MVRALLVGKTQAEKTAIKSAEIAKVDHKGEFVRGSLRIEIQDLAAIESGVEMFARAWKNGKPVGFGVDGTVEIERFRFINPPILVPDAAGDVIFSTSDGVESRYREDVREVVPQMLTGTIAIVGKNGSEIIKGKIGNTVTTVYGSNDARMAVQNAGTWAAARDAATAGFSEAGASSGEACIQVMYQSTGSDYWVMRYGVRFDTSHAFVQHADDHELRDDDGGRKRARGLDDRVAHSHPPHGTRITVRS